MKLMTDIGAQLLGNVALLRERQPGMFLLVLCVGLLLAGLCWMACSHYTRLWNLKYRITLTHHLLCGLAAFLTLIFVTLYAGMSYMKEATDIRIAQWQTELIANDTWGQAVFAHEYDAVKALNVEDFTDHKPPSEGGNVIPFAHLESRKAAAKIVADEAAAQFYDTHPWLSKILNAKADIPIDVVVADVQKYFAEHNDNYPNSQAVAITASVLRDNLAEQTPRVVSLCRTLLVGLFVLFQFIPFGLIGFAAYKDLKVTT